MKNRVNISKLIREKYREDTISADEFNEIVDSVLQESYPGYEYPRNPAYIMQDNFRPQSQVVADIVNGPTGDGAPRHDISTDFNGNIKNHKTRIIPTIVAEQGQSAGQEYTLQVPDIFSMITNSEMKIGSDDRKLIGKIVHNLPGEQIEGQHNWKRRIQSINEFINNSANSPVQTKDIRSAISSLIFLNLLKKLALFTAQPGKLFEYVLAPLIGVEAEVLGSIDQQIIDVTKRSGGETWNYSLKLFTGAKSNFAVEGSRANLAKEIKKSSKPITYVICVTDKQGKMEFSELKITINPQDVKDFRSIAYLKDGIILVDDSSCAVLVLTEENKNLIKFKSENEYQAAKQAAQQAASVAADPIVNLGTKKDYRLSKAKEDLQSLSDSLNQLNNEQSKTNPIDKDKDNLRKILDILKNPSLNNITIKGTNLLFNTSTDTITDTITKSKTSANKKLAIDHILTIANQYAKDLANAIENTQQPQQPVQEAISNPAAPQEDETEKGQFKIPLRGIWEQIPNKIELSLGDASAYNKQQLTIASDLAKNIENTFKAFQELNTNLVKYFATSKEAVRSAGDTEQEFAKNQKATADYVDNAGTAAIENAKTIQDNVSEFQKKENA